MNKKDAFYTLKEAIALPRINGRIDIIREAFKHYEQAVNTPWWKRFLNKFRVSKP